MTVSVKPKVLEQFVEGLKALNLTHVVSKSGTVKIDLTDDAQLLTIIDLYGA